MRHAPKGRGLRGRAVDTALHSSALDTRQREAGRCSLRAHRQGSTEGSNMSGNISSGVKSLRITARPLSTIRGGYGVRTPRTTPAPRPARSPRARRGGWLRESRVLPASTLPFLEGAERVTATHRITVKPKGVA